MTKKLTKTPHSESKHLNTFNTEFLQGRLKYCVEGAVLRVTDERVVFNVRTELSQHWRIDLTWLVVSYLPKCLHAMCTLVCWPLEITLRTRRGGGISSSRYVADCK